MEKLHSSTDVTQLSLFGDEGVAEDSPQDTGSEDKPVGPENCAFCKARIDRDDSSTYHEVITWLRGPRRDSNLARNYTGRKAHRPCLLAVVQGRAASEIPLDEAAESKPDKSDHGDLPDLLARTESDWDAEDSDNSSTILNPIDVFLEN
jgi:hypothetical protein